jgi:hypothetical protein
MTKTLTSFDKKTQLDFFAQLWAEYRKAPWAVTTDLKIVTPAGTFENYGGFNGSPSDLWLRKVGTLGNQKRTFWRISFGGKKEFKIPYFDLRGCDNSKSDVDGYRLDGCYYKLAA